MQLPPCANLTLTGILAAVAIALWPAGCAVWPALPKRSLKPTHRRLVLASSGDATDAENSASPPTWPLRNDGSSVNSDLRVTVTYSDGPLGRARRVRRTRRPSIETRWKLAEDIPGYGRMSAICNFGSISLEQVISLLEGNAGFVAFGSRATIVSYADVVHCRWTTTEGDISDAFFFPYGSVVLWGLTSDQELACIDILAKGGVTEPIVSDEPRWVYSQKASSDELADMEFMLFKPAPPPSSDEASESGPHARRFASVKSNVIELCTLDPAEQLAISFAFAQSAKLSVLEAALEETVEEIREVPEQLSRSGRAQLSAKEIAKLTGRVFLERNEVNLYSNILDCPDFFWEAEEFEPLYRRFNQYLDIEDRVGILNNRLDIVNDLLESLSGQLEIRNSHRLEIIVILLIVIEILLELAKETAAPPVLTWPIHTLRRILSPLFPWIRRVFGG